MDLRVALARNAALAALAWVSLRTAAPDPPWGLPERLDVLPALLAAGALLVAAATAWRAAVWLGKGRA